MSNQKDFIASDSKGQPYFTGDWTKEYIVARGDKKVVVLGSQVLDRVLTGYTVEGVWDGKTLVHSTKHSDTPPANYEARRAARTRLNKAREDAALAAGVRDGRADAENVAKLENQLATQAKQIETLSKQIEALAAKK